MKPSEAYETLADIVTQVAKRPYRDEELSKDEWSEILYRVMRLVEKQEEAVNELHKS